MTLYEQLAQKWHKSIDEIQTIEQQVNTAFFLDVQKMTLDGKWHGVLWGHDRHHRPFIAFSINKGFDHASDAAENINIQMDTLRLPPLKAKGLKWPEDIYLLVKKLKPQQFEKYPVARPLKRMPIVKSQKTYT